jgi:hypothetical protein
MEKFWLKIIGAGSGETLRVPVVQEGRRNTIFFMYMIETCAFFFEILEKTLMF